MFRPVLKELADIQARHIVLACKRDILWQVLNQAQQVGMMTKDQSWILTNLDAHTIDFDPFKYDFTNLTLFRSVDYQRPFVLHSLHRH